MRVRDRRDDRQAEPGAVIGAGAVGAEPLERLSQPGDLGRRKDVAAVLDDQPGRAAISQGGDGDPAAVTVMDDGVADQVVGQAAQQRLAGFNPDAVAVADVLHGQVPGRDRVLVHGQGRRYDVIQRDHGLTRERAVLGAGQHQQSVQKLIDLVQLRADLVGHCDRLGRHWPGLGHGDIHRRANGGQRSAQLVGSVGHEPALRGERAVQPGKGKRVDRVGKVFELVIGAFDGEPLMQIARGDPLRGHGHLAHRA